METFLLNEGGDPGRLCVFNEQIFLNVGDLNEPAIETSVDERGLRAPAEGVTMLDSSA
jgi:hypothetical protein